MAVGRDGARDSSAHTGTRIWQIATSTTWNRQNRLASIQNKYYDEQVIMQQRRLHPVVSATAICNIGFKQQYDIFDYVCKNINNHPPVIDADLLRQNPEKVLKSFCRKVKIPWDVRMLEWEPGLKKYDGVWAKHWYSSVMNSSSFKPIDKKEIFLNENEKKIVKKAMPIYEELYKYVI